eukprot:CAMPEP_0175024254 /NCGR_PEP_ID=MMETSP0005-20121125/16345_1 /TAXON_ID=420556 /ORGANISM="Ochromonas sp., Strain CCMP1393" /LENGTH=182 /DNA_ID=CAMNT_0016282747 /DNA_START=27 /DNA_END=572 /DNA_ORIENTATION=+
MGGCCASKDQLEEVELSTTTNEALCCKSGLKGENVSIATNEENGIYILYGNGTMIGSCCLDCDTAYWEVRVGKNPEGLKIGVKRFPKKVGGKLFEHLDSEPDPNSPAWCLSDTELKEDDVVSVYWDQTDLPMLSFAVNGEMVSYAVTRIRPTVDIYPAVSIRDGSGCEVAFDERDFQFQPKS